MLKKWEIFCKAVNAKGDFKKVFRLLESKYTEEHRKYHTFNHIEKGLELLVQTQNLLEEPLVVEFAFWLHDIVYKIGAVDNKEKSVIIAQQIAKQLKLHDRYSLRASELILYTKHTFIPSETDFDAQILVDIDLAPLGLSTSEFNSFEKNLKMEHVSVPKFESERIVFLKSLLNRPSIFCTPFFRNLFEAKAKSNIRQIVCDKILCFVCGKVIGNLKDDCVQIYAKGWIVEKLNIKENTRIYRHASCDVFSKYYQENGFLANSNFKDLVLRRHDDLNLKQVKETNTSKLYSTSTLSLSNMEQQILDLSWDHFTIKRIKDYFKCSDVKANETLLNLVRKNLMRKERKGREVEYYKV